MPRAGSLVGDIISRTKDRQTRAMTSSSVEALHGGTSTARAKVHRSVHGVTRNSAAWSHKQKTISESVLARKGGSMTHLQSEVAVDTTAPALRANKVRASKERKPAVNKRELEDVTPVVATTDPIIPIPQEILT